jgi:hypothetical protein
LNRKAGLILGWIIQFAGHVMLKVKLDNNRTQSYKSPAEMWGFFVGLFSQKQKNILIGLCNWHKNESLTK